MTSPYLLKPLRSYEDVRAVALGSHETEPSAPSSAPKSNRPKPTARLTPADKGLLLNQASTTKLVTALLVSLIPYLLESSSRR